MADAFRLHTLHGQPLEFSFSFALDHKALSALLHTLATQQPRVLSKVGQLRLHAWGSIRDWNAAHLSQLMANVDASALPRLHTLQLDSNDAVAASLSTPLLTFVRTLAANVRHLDLRVTSLSAEQCSWFVAALKVLGPSLQTFAWSANGLDDSPRFGGRGDSDDDHDDEENTNDSASDKNIASVMQALSVHCLRVQSVTVTIDRSKLRCFAALSTLPSLTELVVPGCLELRGSDKAMFAREEAFPALQRLKLIAYHTAVLARHLSSLIEGLEVQQRTRRQRHDHQPASLQQFELMLAQQASLRGGSYGLSLLPHVQRFALRSMWMGDELRKQLGQALCTADAVTGAGAGAAGGSWPLRELRLDGVHLHDVLVAVGQASSPLRLLESLSLEGNWAKLGAVSARALCALPALTSLHMHYCDGAGNRMTAGTARETAADQLTEAAMAAGFLAELPLAAPHLRHLNFLPRHRRYAEYWGDPNSSTVAASAELRRAHQHTLLQLLQRARQLETVEVGTEWLDPGVILTNAAQWVRVLEQPYSVLSAVVGDGMSLRALPLPPAAGALCAALLRNCSLERLHFAFRGPVPASAQASGSSASASVNDGNAGEELSDFLRRILRRNVLRRVRLAVNWCMCALVISFKRAVGAGASCALSDSVLPLVPEITDLSFSPLEVLIEL